MMSCNPLISVIIPVYKVKEYLETSVASVVNQTYKNLEIILIDDGSPDECPAMCDHWGKMDGRVTVIHKENGGLSDARNVGLSIAKGEYISFVDSDDWIAKEMIERLLVAMLRDKSDIASCNVEIIWEDGRSEKMMPDYKDCVMNKIEAQKALLEESLIKQTVWNKLYRRDIIQGIPFEVGKYHEDAYWSYQAIGNADKVSLIGYTGYFYRQRSDSIMGSNYSMKRLDVLKAYEMRARYMENRFPVLAPRARTSVLTICIYHGQMALKYLSGQLREEAFNLLAETMQRNPLLPKDTKGLKISHRVWLLMAHISLPMTCRIKNALNIGL